MLWPSRTVECTVLVQAHAIFAFENYHNSNSFGSTTANKLLTKFIPYIIIKTNCNFLCEYSIQFLICLIID